MLTFLLQARYAIDTDDGNHPLFLLLCFLGFPIIIFLSAYFTRGNDDKFQLGTFNGRLAFSRDHLMEAYICLGARIIRGDRKDSGEKIVYMNNYFQKHFPNSLYDFSDSLSHSLRYPVNLRTVSTWLKIHLPLKKDKLQVMYFLTGLAMLDGRFTREELKTLKETSEFLGLSPKEFDSIIAMYLGYEEEKRSQVAPKPRKSVLQVSAQVLGVSENASLDEVKKAYRKLVKLHHPDRFINSTPDQQKLAQERFIKIQKAYEVFENRR